MINFFNKISCTIGLFFLADLILFAEDFWPNRVYLATYPRAGNHWMRYMLEELTGKATGSVYRDLDEPVHLGNIFPWGGYAPVGGYEGNRIYPEFGDLYILKTHFPVMGGFEPVQIAAIRIVRNPLDSFYSYATFLKLCNNSEFPEKLTERFIQEFKTFHNFWDNQDPVLTIRYEDLLLNQKEILSEVATFLKIPFHKDDIDRVVKRYPPFGHYLKHKSKFSENTIHKINTEFKDFLFRFGYNLDN